MDLPSIFHAEVSEECACIMNDACCEYFSKRIPYIKLNGICTGLMCSTKAHQKERSKQKLITTSQSNKILSTSKDGQLKQLKQLKQSNKLNDVQRCVEKWQLAWYT